MILPLVLWEFSIVFGDRNHIFSNGMVADIAYWSVSRSYGIIPYEVSIFEIEKGRGVAKVKL